MLLYSRNLINKSRYNMSIKDRSKCLLDHFLRASGMAGSGWGPHYITEITQHLLKALLLNISYTEARHCFPPINQCLDTSKVLVHIYWVNTFMSMFFTGLSPSSLWPSLLQKVSKICKLVTSFIFIWCE